MSIESITDQKKQALITLLDDPSPVVVDAVAREFEEMGALAIEMLREAREHDDPVVAQAAKDWLLKLGGEDPADVFLEFINSFQYELETGCLLLDRTTFNDLDAAAYYNFMDKIAGRCRELLLSPSSHYEKCKVINRVLFHEYGFRGDHDHLMSPMNSYLHQVVLRRRGLPISLSILYMLIAERCGIQMEAISLPGYFMIACFMDRSPFFVDPFGGGVIRSVEQLEDFLQTRHIPFQERYLHPTPVGEVLCRICRNLSNQYAHEKDDKRSSFFTGFVQAFNDAYRNHAKS